MFSKDVRSEISPPAEASQPLVLGEIESQSQHDDLLTRASFDEKAPQAEQPSALEACPLPETEKPATPGVVGTILQHLTHPSYLLAAVRTWGAVRPEMVDGQLELVVTPSASLPADPRQGPDRREDNKYERIFKEIKDEHRRQTGEELRLLTREIMAQHGIEPPCVYLSPTGYVEMRDHHRLWAVMGDRSLNLSIVVTPLGDDISFN